MLNVATITTFQGVHRFLSNFHPCPVVWDGKVYPSAEHAYQAAKTLDPKERAMIRDMPTAGRAKRAGQVLTLRADWDSIRLAVMHDIVWRKFRYNPELGQRLAATGDALLVEGNPWNDRFWGMTWDKTVNAWVGKNHLGEILMKVRAELQPQVTR